jgi:Fe-S cluster biogenesis protein NfuA
MDDKETRELIVQTLDKIRPFINRDGGDIEFVDFIDGIVYVQMLGACEGCSLIDSTLTEGVEIILTDEVPGVLGVKLASQMPNKNEGN